MTLAGQQRRVLFALDRRAEEFPLVRWQFMGGIAEAERRAFLFTNVTDSKGRRYDMPVAVGALSASPGIYALGMGVAVEEIGEVWNHAIANPIPPELTTDPPCQQ